MSELSFIYVHLIYHQSFDIINFLDEIFLEINTNKKEENKILNSNYALE